MYVYNTPQIVKSKLERALQVIDLAITHAIVIIFLVTITEFVLRAENTFSNALSSVAETRIVANSLQAVLNNCTVVSHLSVAFAPVDVQMTSSSAPLTLSYITILISTILIVSGIQIMINSLLKYAYAYSVQYMRIRGLLIPMASLMVALDVALSFTVVLTIGSTYSTRQFLDDYVDDCAQQLKTRDLIKFYESDIDTDTVFGTPLWPLLVIMCINLFMYAVQFSLKIYFAWSKAEVKMLRAEYPYLKGHFLCIPRDPLLLEYNLLRAAKIQQIENNYEDTNPFFQPILQQEYLDDDGHNFTLEASLTLNDLGDKGLRRTMLETMVKDCEGPGGSVILQVPRTFIVGKDNLPISASESKSGGGRLRRRYGGDARALAESRRAQAEHDRLFKEISLSQRKSTNNNVGGAGRMPTETPHTAARREGIVARLADNVSEFAATPTTTSDNRPTAGSTMINNNGLLPENANLNGRGGGGGSVVVGVNEDDFFGLPPPQTGLTPIPNGNAPISGGTAGGGGGGLFEPSPMAVSTQSLQQHIITTMNGRPSVNQGGDNVGPTAIQTNNENQYLLSQTALPTSPGVDGRLEDNNRVGGQKQANTNSNNGNDEEDDFIYDNPDDGGAEMTQFGNDDDDIISYGGGHQSNNGKTKRSGSSGRSEKKDTGKHSSSNSKGKSKRKDDEQDRSEGKSHKKHGRKNRRGSTATATSSGGERDDVEMNVYGGSSSAALTMLGEDDDDDHTYSSGKGKHKEMRKNRVYDTNGDRQQLYPAQEAGEEDEGDAPIYAYYDGDGNLLGEGTTLEGLNDEDYVIAEYDEDGNLVTIGGGGGGEDGRLFGDNTEGDQEEDDILSEGRETIGGPRRSSSSSSKREKKKDKKKKDKKDKKEKISKSGRGRSHSKERRERGGDQQLRSPAVYDARVSPPISTPKSNLAPPLASPTRGNNDGNHNNNNNRFVSTSSTTLMGPATTRSLIAPGQDSDTDDRQVRRVRTQAGDDEQYEPVPPPPPTSKLSAMQRGL